MPGHRIKLAAAVVGVLALLAGGASALHDPTPRQTCDDGATVYMYDESEVGPLSREDCLDDWTPYAPLR